VVCCRQHKQLINQKRPLTRWAFLLEELIMQVQIKFIVGGANSAIGGFSAGDTLRCPAELAAHLVNEVKCAEYIAAPAAIAAEADKPRRKGK
jgi:hypothetical protein